VHSDCDGKLKLDYLPALRDRLVELEPKYDAIVRDDDYLTGRLRQFIEGLDQAIELGEDVDFH